MTPHLPAFAKLVAEHGYELRLHDPANPYQHTEVIAKPHRYGDLIVDAVSFTHSRDRGDVLERSATLIGWGENRRFAIGELLCLLGVAPTGTGNDFVEAAIRLDQATIERLAP